MPGCIALLSQLTALPGASADTDISKELSVSISHRNDNLNWNIAGSTVDVLSELKWEDMSIAQLQTAGEIHLKNELRVRASLGYGVVNSGTNQDSDYKGNNRTQEFSRSISDAGGDVLDASIGLGQKLHLRDLSAGKSFYLTPFLGLSVHQQNLTMTNGVQVIPASGPFPGLSSSYDAQWMGPWWGAEALIETERGWSVKANLEYHLIDYSANANWNLRADLVHPISFKHTAKGDGILMSLGASYPFKKNWKMDFTLERHNWSTNAGNDQIFLADGTIGYARLNAVNWDSTAYFFGIVREF
jgi:hypothetical protein